MSTAAAGDPQPTRVTITHLEMTAPEQLRPKAPGRPDLVVVRAIPPMPELNRFFYTAVGGDWYWLERLAWTYSDWLKYVDRPELETWLITAAGVPAGYFELEAQPEANVEIAYFGLLPAFVGQSAGGWALSEAVRCGWAMGAKRVWVHTCDLDHPGALPNYLSRGFRVFKIETKEELLPVRSPGPWPGART